MIEPLATVSPAARQPRYVVYGEIASGGMASIHYGELSGPGGFLRPLAFKRLHPQFAKDPAFVSMFLDEARVSSRIVHANVVATLDVLQAGDDVRVVMEYVPGESLARLLGLCRQRGEAVPPRIAGAIIAAVLYGLHAAHETVGDNGEPLGIVHRDVSPENILVGTDGVARILDFGIAKALGGSRATPAGELKGKLAYMSAEQFQHGQVDRRTDVYAASVVLWRSLAGREPFTAPSDAALVRAILEDEVLPPSTFSAEIPPALDAIVLRGMERDPERRFASASAMAQALEREVGVASQSEVSAWVVSLAHASLEARAQQISEMRDFPHTPTKVAATTPTGAAAAPAPPSAAGESGPRRKPTHTRRRSLLLLLAASLSALGYAFFVLRIDATRASQDPPPSGAGADTAPAVEPTPGRRPFAPAQPERVDAPPDEPAAEVIPEPASARPAVTPEPSAPLAAPERGASSARAPRPTRRASAHAASRPAAAPPAAEVDCSVPYELDRTGVRRIKRECL